MTREREKVLAGLRAQRDLEVFPSVTNFVLFRHRQRKAAELHAAILERGVLIRDVSMWPGADECLRATVGTTVENERLLGAVRAALATAPAPAGRG
jgi:histidinol-phosphate aminotransferase